MDRITTHPGEILREEFLSPLGISAHALAVSIKVPASRISEIVKERRGISVDTAVRLAKYFGMSADFWLNLQRSYDISQIEKEKSFEIEHIIPYKEKNRNSLYA